MASSARLWSSAMVAIATVMALLARPTWSAEPLPPSPPAVAAGLRAWNVSPVDHLLDRAFDGPQQALKPVRLVAPRGGLGLGQVVVTDAAGLKGLTASLSRLTCNGVSVPAKVLTVKFGAAATDPRLAAWRQFKYLPVLLDKAPEARLVPVWLIAEAPADSPAGTYTGTLTLKTADTCTVPVELVVSPWQAPKPRDFMVRFDIYQSPESVARAYNVPLWSDAHWKLVGRSLDLVGRFGSKVLWVPLIAGGTDGLTESMVRYTRQAGTWKADTSRLDRYLGLYEKSCGTPDSIMCYVWYPGADIHPRKQPDPVKVRPFKITLADGASAEVQNFTPDAQAFWRTALDAARASVLKRKWPESALMLGIAMDTRPSELFVRQLQKAAPSATWVLHSHDQAPDIQGIKVGYCAHMRGGAGWDGPGWAHPRLLLDYPYDEGPRQGPARDHCVTIQAVAAHKRGMGRVLADFWTANMWVGGQPTMMNFGAYIFAPGPSGAEQTVASLMYLDGLQQAEACARIERAVIENKALPADVAKRGSATVARLRGLTWAAERHNRHEWRAIFDKYEGNNYDARAIALYQAAADCTAETK